MQDGGVDGKGYLFKDCKDESLGSLLGFFWHEEGHSFFLWCLTGVEHPSSKITCHSKRFCPSFVGQRGRREVMEWA